MKAFLLHAGRDADAGPPPPGAADLAQDLGLGTVVAGMAADDEFVSGVAQRALLASLSDPEEIRYRQQALRDCLGHAPVVREIYEIATAAVAGERKIFGGAFLARSPDGILRRSVSVLELLVGQLRQLRRVAGEHGSAFRSDGFTRFFRMLGDELGDGYFDAVDEHLRRLRFDDGVLISARLGEGNRGVGHVLRKPREIRRGLARAMPMWGRPGHTLTIADRDEAGTRALAELRDRGVSLVADALAQSTDHILSFFATLRSELAFYIGCLNLHDLLTGQGEPVCFPTPVDAGARAFSCRGLYDPGLALTDRGEVAGNDVDVGGRRLILITGANQGGKSTFLRSVGLAQLMMQCGMFASAQRLEASVCHGLFTHFKREEDETMTSGKLDEELARMSAATDSMSPGSLLLCNESFAATNEREGAQIAREVVTALTDSGVRVFFVTHAYELARGFHQEGRGDVAFLRAGREADGRRTFRLSEGAPSPTAHAQDVYRSVFGAPGGAPPGSAGPAPAPPPG